MNEIILTEPKQAPYIHVDSNGNLQLLVPISEGEDIGTDNTCKAAEKLKQFFGKARGDLESGLAITTLKSYIKCLKCDIRILGSNEDYSTLKQQKEKRLLQAEAYIETIKIIKSKANLRGLYNPNHAWVKFPNPILKLMNEKTNLFSIRLRPTAQDPHLSAQGHIFTVIRENDYSGEPKSNLYNSLQTVQINKVTELANRVREHLNKNEEYKQSQATEEMFAEIKNEITERAVTILGKEVNFELEIPGSNRRIKIDLDYFKLILAEDNITGEYLLENIESLINCGKSAPMVAFNKAPFKQASNTEELSILTQFFLAQINIYCYANKISTDDFGKLLDASSTNSQKLAQIINDNLKLDNIELKIIEFVEDNILRIKLSDTDKEIILQRFRRQWLIVQHSDHLDEFIVLDTQTKGAFVSHHGSICVGLSVLALTGEFKDTVETHLDQSNLNLMHNLKDDYDHIEQTVPANNVINQTVELTIEEIHKVLLGLLELNENYDIEVLGRFLSAKTSDNIICDLLDYADYDFQSAPGWDVLDDQVKDFPDKNSKEYDIYYEISKSVGICVSNGAAARNDLEILTEDLEDYGLDVVDNPCGRGTPLGEAVAHGNIEAIKILFRYNANIYVEYDGTCLIKKALEHVNPEIRQLFKERIQLIEGIRNSINDINLVQFDNLIDQLNNVDIILPDGKTPLILAADVGADAIVHKLLKKGAWLFNTGKAKANALIFAARKGRLEIVKLLLGGSVYHINDKGMVLSVKPQHTEFLTALQSAAYHGHAPVVALLISKGAKYKDSQINGISVKEWAQTNNHADVIEAINTIEQPDQQDIQVQDNSQNVGWQNPSAQRKRARDEESEHDVNDARESNDNSTDRNNDDSDSEPNHSKRTRA